MGPARGVAWSNECSRHKCCLKCDSISAIDRVVYGHLKRSLRKKLHPYPGLHGDGGLEMMHGVFGLSLSMSIFRQSVHLTVLVSRAALI